MIDLSAGQDEESIVWRIEAIEPTAVTHFVVGEVPTGFVATITLAAESLDNESKYAAEAEVSRSGLPIRTGFSLPELENELWRVGGRRLVADSEFERESREFCP